MPTDVGAVAFAVGESAKLAYELIHKDQRQEIELARLRAKGDCEKFKQALLHDDNVIVGAMLDGLPSGLSVDLSSAEIVALQQRQREHTAYELLGYYCRAREVAFLADAIVIRETTKPE